jgi:hypothetical protein
MSNHQLGTNKLTPMPSVPSGSSLNNLGPSGLSFTERLIAPFGNSRHNDPILYTALFKHKFVRVFTDAWEQRPQRSRSATSRLRCMSSTQNSPASSSRQGEDDPSVHPLLTLSLPKALSLSPSLSPAPPSDPRQSSSTPSPCLQDCVYCEDQPEVCHINKVL